MSGSEPTSREVRIRPIERGPYEVTGPIELRGADGTTLELGAETVLLCRCGESERKPFCDSWTAGACARQVGS